MSKLDTDLFRKVLALVHGGATEGERAAAHSRATVIARAAGMTFEEAVSSLDKAKAERPASSVKSFDDWMEEREPGYKAQQTERERVRRARCAELLQQYGSEQAVFAETERERLLRTTLEPMADRRKYSNSTGSYIAGYDGWTCGKPHRRLWEALDTAYALPRTVTGAWAEHQQWQRSSEDRLTFDPYFDTPVHVQARQYALESILDTWSDPTPEGIRARLDWMDFCIKSDRYRHLDEEASTLFALRLDFEMLMMSVQSGRDDIPDAPSSVRRTNAQKRADVLSILDKHPEWTDREIAKRTGVSPQTVNTWRKKRGT